MDSIAFLASLQHHLADIDSLLRWLSLHTYTSYYLLVALTLYWSGFATTGARLGCGVLFSTLLLGSCRQFFASPRPYWNNPQLFNGFTEKAWGMPSGHTQNATVFWGLSAFSVKLKLFSFFCLLMIITIAVSRMYLGVHFPAQIIAGLSIGIMFLFFWITFETTALNHLKTYSLSGQFILIFLASGLPLLITLVLRDVAGLGSGNGEALAYKKLFFLSGLLQGGGTSLLLAFRFNKTTNSTFSLTLLLTRTLPGILSVWLLWKYKYLYPDFIESKISLYSVFWLQGIFLAFWACLLWPSCHHKIFKTKIMQK